MVASLNISGCGAPDHLHVSSKWQALNQAMRDSRIGIMALQEAHLDESTIERIHSIYGRRLRVFASAAPRTNNAQGVAFVLNRELVDTSNVKISPIIPGRALYIELRWHAGKMIRILNVYAPNAAGENTQFWTDVKGAITRAHLTKPDVMLGDFNITEEPIDRLPARCPGPKVFGPMNTENTSTVRYVQHTVKRPAQAGNDQTGKSLPDLAGIGVYRSTDTFKAPKSLSRRQSHIKR